MRTILQARHADSGIRARAGHALFGLVVMGLAVPVLAMPARAQAGPAPGADVTRIRVHDIRVGGNPGQIVIDHRSRAVWVAAGTRLVRVDEATRRVTATARIRSQFAAADPGTRTVWTWSLVSRSVEEVSAVTAKVIRRIGGLPIVEGMAADPRTRTVWVAFAKFDQATGKTITALAEISEVHQRIVRQVRLHLNDKQVVSALTIDSRTGTVWVAVVDGTNNNAPTWVSEVSESAARVVHVYPFYNPGFYTAALAVDSARGTVWLALPHAPTATVEVIGEKEHRIVRSFAAQIAAGLAIDSRARTVVADGMRGDVVFLNERTGAVMGTVRGAAGFIAEDQAAGQVYAEETGAGRTGYIAEFRI